jgi:hypothetical protein
MFIFRRQTTCLRELEGRLVQQHAKGHQMEVDLKRKLRLFEVKFFRTRGLIKGFKILIEATG